MVTIPEPIPYAIWLCHHYDSDPIDALPPYLSALHSANWWPLLRHPIVAHVLRQLLLEPSATDAAAADLLATHADTEPAELLAIAIAALQSFVLDNFLGPPLDPLHYDQLPCAALLQQQPDTAVAAATIVDALQLDGVECNANVQHPELLVVARRVLSALQRAEADAPEVAGNGGWLLSWWSMRAANIHEQCLHEQTESNHQLFSGASERLVQWLRADGECGLDRETGALLLLECAQGHLGYRRAWKAAPLLEAARERLAVELRVQGFLGRRTKWQQKALPQLALRVAATGAVAEGQKEEVVEEEEAGLSAKQTHGQSALPCLLRLDDDVRLERVTFELEEDNRQLELPAVQQQLVLGILQHLIISQPADTLATEELQPYLTTLLYQPHGPWPARIAALLLNIHLESTHKRTVERSLKQCEEVAHLLCTAPTAAGNADSAATGRQRLSLAHSSHLRPHWQVRSQLGRLMISLGMIKTALGLYRDLRQWSEVITCYTLLDLPHLAAEICEQELAKQPGSVELLCLLGDATDEPQHYERAWLVSKQRSGRAQRHWGQWHFARKEYAAAIPHLRLSLQQNSLQDAVLLRLGYAYLQLEDWAHAAEVYRLYTNLEPNGFESWNNLCKAYVQLGDKRRAHKVLQEALKCNFGNWKVWENYLLVSTDTGNFEDALNAYAQLLALRGKHWDAAVLGIVCRAIAADVPDASGRPTQRLRPKARKLIGHLGVLQPTEPLVWELAAALHAGEPLAEAQALQKAYRAHTQRGAGGGDGGGGDGAEWWRDAPGIVRVLGVCERLAEASCRAWHERTESGRAACASQLSSARLSVQGAVRAARDGGALEAATTAEAELAETVRSLESRLEEIRELLLQR